MMEMALAQTRRGAWLQRASATVVLVLGVACSSGPTAAPVPTPLPPPPPSSPVPTPTPVATTTIRITTNGVTPSDIQVALGSRVTFVNEDSRPHDMTSDPHPSHVDCPEVNEVGNLSPGRSGITAPLSRARRCGFHDHGEPNNNRLSGSITIQ